MGYKIVNKESLNSVTERVDIEAPLVAKKAKAGQFVVLRLDEKGERIPLTVASKNPVGGIISIIFQVVGKTTKKLSCLKKDDEILDLIGPLGRPTGFGDAGEVIFVGGGVGIAEILPVIKYAGENKNHITSILGARTKELLILEDKIRPLSDNIFLTTDDGSHGEKGLVTLPLQRLLEKDKFNLCYTVGPDIMMRAVSEVTKKYNLKTIVSLDANMVDATGMCGTCRVTVGNKTKFACVDGPEFDGHEVDFDEFMKRQVRFKEEEMRSLNIFEKECKCKTK